MNVRDLLAAATKKLGGIEARIDAELLLAHVLNVSRAWLYAWPEHVPDAAQREAFDQHVVARQRGEPIAYLTGHREFWSLDLEVSPAVLIPRPETELLVELALERIPRDRVMRVADLGTGSGAIALALARERPLAQVLATDASDVALDVARRNAVRLAIDNVTFAQGDWCAALTVGPFDLIASNPPYIAPDDAHLETGDLRREPRMALVSGTDGLGAIRSIVADAPAHLVAGGWLLLEHGWDQAARIRELFESHAYEDISSTCDAAGHERVTRGRKRD